MLSAITSRANLNIPTNNPSVPTQPSDLSFFSEFSNIQSQLDQKGNHIKSFRKSYFITLVKACDRTNPCVSKFGSRPPFLPSEGCPHKCSYCSQSASIVFSLYIRSLPPEIQSYFPPDELEAVLVGFACERCHDFFDITRYIGSDIDSLIYGDIDPNFVFNEPRVVTGWKQSTMTPISVYTLEKLHPGMNEEVEIEIVRCEFENIFGLICKFSARRLPDTVLMLEMEESEALTNLWGDCGIAQVWMTTGDDKIC